MKKLFILSTLILSTPLWAQTYMQNARSVNDIAASSYQIAPGVSISPPMWSRNLGNNSYGNNTNTYGNNANTYGNNTNSNNRNPNPIANGELNPGIIPAPGNPNSVGSNVSVNIPSANSKNSSDIPTNKVAPPVQSTNNLPMTTSQPLATSKPLPKPAIVAGNISSWNRTTQQEIESKANTELQEKYKAFLMQK